MSTLEEEKKQVPIPVPTSSVVVSDGEESSDSDNDNDNGTVYKPTTGFVIPSVQQHSIFSPPTATPSFTFIPSKPIAR